MGGAGLERCNSASTVPKQHCVNGPACCAKLACLQLSHPRYLEATSNLIEYLICELTCTLGRICVHRLYVMKNELQKINYEEQI